MKRHAEAFVMISKRKPVSVPDQAVRDVKGTRQAVHSLLVLFPFVFPTALGNFYDSPDYRHKKTNDRKPR